MKIAVLKESEGETRCAAIPETLRKYIALGAEVAVEAAAGKDASIDDSEFVAAGATVGPRAEVLSGAGIVLTVNGADPQSLGGVAPGALLVGALDPLQRRAAIDGYAAAGIDAAAAARLQPRCRGAGAQQSRRRYRHWPRPGRHARGIEQLS